MNKHQKGSETSKNAWLNVLSIYYQSENFKERMECQKECVTQYSDEKLKWKIENNIEVPPGKQTKAELVIKEDSFNGNFVMPCTFEGKILVTYMGRDTKEQMITISAKARTVFDIKDGFTIDELNRPTYAVKGFCDCRYSVEQIVKLTQTIIPPGEADD